jgi:hypothetical protein
MNRIITVSLLIFGLGYIGNQLYVEHIDFMNLTQQEANIQWALGLIRDIGYVFLCFFAISGSIFKYKITKNKIKAKINIVLSVGFVLSVSIFSSYLYYEMSQFPPVTGTILERTPNLLKKHKSWLKENDGNQEEKIKRTNLMASMVYKDSGIFLDVLNENGLIITYAPTEKDVQLRRDALRAEQLMKHSTKALLGASIVNWAVLFCGVIIGLVSARWRRSYNKAIKSDS